MEKNNNIVIKSFLKEEEKSLILDYIKTIDNNQIFLNEHIKQVSKELKGDSYIYDLTNTDVSKYLSTFQSSNNILDNKKLPNIFFIIKDRISEMVKIPKEHVFLQIIEMKSGGKVKKHYDTGYKGYINYKCNIAVKSEDYKLFLDNTELDINEGDLYCFEASLYKHWTNEFNSDRVLLSYGFGIDYNSLGRDLNDPRVRLSERIVKYFQN